MTTSLERTYEQIIDNETDHEVKISFARVCEELSMISDVYHGIDQAVVSIDYIPLLIGLDFWLAELGESIHNTQWSSSMISELGIKKDALFDPVDELHPESLDDQRTAFNEVKTNFNATLKSTDTPSFGESYAISLGLQLWGETLGYSTDYPLLDINNSRNAHQPA